MTQRDSLLRPASTLAVADSGPWRQDGYFLRTAASDCPAEGLSAFALEADDMRILLRDVTPRSLAAIDELGRGTAPRWHAAPILSSEFGRDAEERNQCRIFDERSLNLHLVARGGRDGAALVGALLEELARRGGPTIFGAPPCRSTPHHYCLLSR